MSTASTVSLLIAAHTDIMDTTRIAKDRATWPHLRDHVERFTRGLKPTQDERLADCLAKWKELVTEINQRPNLYGVTPHDWPEETKGVFARFQKALI